MHSPIYTYTGPTWALKSFDRPEVEQLHGSTNFAKHWQWPFRSRVYPSAPPLSIVKYLCESERQTLPIVWVYSDPWGNIPDITGIALKDYVQRQDWFDIWRDCNRHILKSIAEIGPPVLIIGSHCDIIDCDFDNIIVASHSMQKFMAHLAGITVVDDTVIMPHDNIKINHCFAMEIYFRFFHETSDIVPCNDLHDRVVDLWVFWKKLEQAGLMYDVHPTRTSYENFAQSLLPMVTTFLNQT